MYVYFPFFSGFFIFFLVGLFLSFLRGREEGREGGREGGEVLLVLAQTFYFWPGFSGDGKEAGMCVCVCVCVCIDLHFDALFDIWNMNLNDLRFV